ncbi:MAG: FAD-dependent oxidoreductase [Candidatus Kapabacteria bacterium]|nr:FAD-dependent oxidoreductase [Candidatus Kapabacteria bacterium]
MKQTQSRRILIVGAGVAGISAAVECIRRGHTPVLLEAKPYIGGRARSFTDTATGDTIDNGQHVMMGCYHSLLGVLRLLGTDTLLEEQPSLRVAFVDADGRHDELDASLLPGKAGVALGILRLKHIGIRAKVKALIFALRVQFNLLDCKAMTARELLEATGQPPDIITRLWEPLILATLNATPENAAAVLFVEVLRRAMFGGGNSSSLLIPRCGLSDLFEPAHGFIASNGGELHTGTSVANLLIRNGAVCGVATEDGRTIEGDTVIVAVPPKYVLRLIAEGYHTHPFFAPLHDYTFSPIVSLYLWFDRPVMQNDFAALLGTTTQWVFNKTATDSPNGGHVALTVSAANPLVQQSAEDLARHCADELRASFPQARNAVLTGYKVIKEKSATFLATPHLESRRLCAITPLTGLYLAGDWTATGLPATLEGAAQSGIAAVAAIG